MTHTVMGKSVRDLHNDFHEGAETEVVAISIAKDGSWFSTVSGVNQLGNEVIRKVLLEAAATLEDDRETQH